jgi:TonB-dependent SusC/RagA subfamily outer membrane receptor
MKKFCKQKEVCYFSDSGGLTLKKMLRMARFTVFCFFLGLIQVMAIDTYSQQTRLSVNYQNESLENVLRAIEKESEFFFLYNRDLIDVDHNVTISADNQLIKGILDELFSGTDIRYAIFDRQIVLSNKEAISEMTAQQQKSVTGKVTNTSGEPLPGVTVVVKGTTTGIVSSVDGTFTISNIPPDASLVFSFVGMKLQEIAIGNKTVINVVMEEETVGIGEVVAIGYGTVKKSSVTAAVAKLTNEGLNQIAVGRADLTLIGQLPGISVRQASTRPGDAPVIRIRGVSSITGVNDPLYVVDGVPINGDLNSVNAGDIESIEVLKDASSAAIYGSRAAAGVVMITTKRGTGQKPSFNIGSYFGVRTPTYLVKDYHNARDAFDYAVKFTNYNYINSGGNPSVPVYQRPAAYRPDSLYLKLGDTDWQKELLRNALMQNHDKILYIC